MAGNRQKPGHHLDVWGGWFKGGPKRRELMILATTMDEADAARALELIETSNIGKEADDARDSGTSGP